MLKFDYVTYEDILYNMKKINRIYKFNEVESKTKSGFILRHDVDFDIKKAYKLAEVEKGVDITSTFFILTTSEMYNIMSSDNRKMLMDMIQEGFEIGLHFDPIIYNNLTENKLYEKVKVESEIIESITGQRVDSISLHNPSIHGQYPMFNNYKNAYEEIYFNPELYISDSCKDFRGKEIFSFMENGRDNLIQVLFHPIHFSQYEENYTHSFSKIFRNKILDFHTKLLINKTYRNEGESIIDALKIKA